MCSIRDLKEQFSNGTLSPVAHTKTVLSSIKKANEKLNAVSWFRSEDEILKDALQSEQRYKEGKPLGTFDGIPVTVKDIESNACAGIPLKNGSMMTALHRTPTESALHIEILQRQGAIIICQTTSPELGFKATTSTKLNGVTLNPRDTTLTSGGSSGGAAAIAASVGCLNLGSDGGGSIRIPAACCGVVGFKPSYGIGIKASFPYTAHTGPICQSSEDAIDYMREMVNGHDWDNLSQPDMKFLRQSFSNVSEFNSASCSKAVEGLRVAVAPTILGGEVDSRVWDSVQLAASVFKNMGATVTEIQPPLSHLRSDFTLAFGDIWKCLMLSEMKKVPESDKDNMDPLLKRLYKRGTNLSAAEVINSQIVRDKVRSIMTSLMSDYDLILSPTLLSLPPKAFKFDSREELINFRQGGMTSVTSIFNISHQPACSVPCSPVGNIPVGLHIAGGLYNDALVLKAAKAFQQKTESSSKL